MSSAVELRNEQAEQRPATGSERGRGRLKQVRVRCPRCHGTGKDIVKIAGKTKPTIDECPVCHGQGYLVKGETNEQAPTNSMGSSSSLRGTGAVDTYDPASTRPFKGTTKPPKIFKRRPSNVGVVGKPIGTGNIDAIKETAAGDMPDLKGPLRVRKGHNLTADYDMIHVGRGNPVDLRPQLKTRPRQMPDGTTLESCWNEALPFIEEYLGEPLSLIQREQVCERFIRECGPLFTEPKTRDELVMESIGAAIAGTMRRR